MARIRRIQPINPGAPIPPPESAPIQLPGFGRPINLAEPRVARPIQQFPSMGRPLGRPDAIPLEAGPAPIAPPMPDTFPLAEGPTPLPMSPVGGTPPADPYPVVGDPYVNRNPAEQRVSRFTDPAATPRPGPGAYDAVRNAARGPATPFVKPGSASASAPAPSGPAGIPGPRAQGQLPSPGPQRPAIPMGGPAPRPAPAPAGLAGPRQALGLPAPGPAKPAIPLGGANAYTPPNAAGATEAIGGATPNRPGRYAGAQRPPADPNFNFFRKPLGLPGPGPAPQPTPGPEAPFNARTASRAASFNGVNTPQSFRGPAPRASFAPTPGRAATAVRNVGPMLALEAASNPEGFAHAVGHPLEAMGGALSSAADGLSGLYDGRFREGARRLVTGDGDAWKYALMNAPVASQIHAAGVNMGNGASQWIKDPSEGLAAFGRGFERIGNAVFGPSGGPAPAAPAAPAAPQAPDGNPNGLSPEFLAQVQAGGGNPANYTMLGGSLVSAPGASASQAPAMPGAGATADQLNAFWQSQGVGAGVKSPGPQPLAPGAPAAPAAPTSGTLVAGGSQPSGFSGIERQQAIIAQKTMGMLSRQMSGLQAQYDRYRNPEMRAGIATEMARVSQALEGQQQQLTRLGTAPAERRLMDARATEAVNSNRPLGERLREITTDPKAYEAYLVSKNVPAEDIPFLVERNRAAQSQGNAGPVAGGQIDQQSYQNVLRGNSYFDGLRPLFDPTHAGFQANAGLTDILDRAMMYPGATEPNSPVAQLIREGVRGRYPGEALNGQVATFRNNPRNWFGDAARDAKYRNYLRSIGMNEVPGA